LNKALSTQLLTNSFPYWSRVRNDEQSAGYQLLNPAGLQIDQLRKQTERINANYFFPTSIVDDIDIYYRLTLPKSFEFTLSNDDTELSFDAPTVSGLFDGTYYSVSLVEDNTVETLWYKTAPNRITIDDTVEFKNHLVASGYVNTRLNTLVNSGILDLTNQLTVSLSGAELCIDIQNGVPVIGRAQIYGTNRAGQDIVEELILLNDGTQKTINEFATFSSLYPYGITPNTAEILVTSWHKNDQVIGEDTYHETAYTLGVTIDKQTMPLYWTTRSGEAIDHPTQHTLELHKYDVDDPELRLDGWTDKSVWNRYELINQSGLHFAPVDMTVQPWSEWIWLVDNQNLYLFDDGLQYPNTKSLNAKDYDTSATVNPSQYAVVSGETIDLEYTWDRPSIGLVKHRAWVEKPDGTKYSLEDGIEETYHSNASSWVIEEPHTRYIKPTETYTLDQRGQYTYCLQTYYTNETTFTDKKIVSVNYKEPRAQFFLPAAGIFTDIIAVDIDSEGKLWIFDDTYRYQIGLHYDKMLIDIDKKIIYFKEPYDQIRCIG